MNAQTKGALRSKAVWGAILTLVSAFGLLPFGISFDPASGIVSFNVYDVANAFAVAAIPGGAALSIFGRWVAKTPITGLW